MLVNHADVAGVFHLELDEELARVDADLGDALVRVCNFSQLRIQTLLALALTHLDL